MGSAKLVKSAKSEKSVKAAKGTKKDKKGEKKTQINAEEECILPVIKGKVGEPYWLQTGQVMTQWEEAYGYPRKSFTSKSKSRKGAKSGSRKIVNNDQYMVHCNQKGYVPDEVCIYTCIDGTLDTTMYCNKNPEDVCVLGRELTITEQCPIDIGGYTSDGYEYGPDTLYNSKYIVDSFVQDI